METKKEIKTEQIIIVDATDATFGRLCSYVAKQALEGKEVAVLNSEKAVITGSKADIIKKHNASRQRGGYSGKGPKYINIPYQILKRGIRGMLPDFRWGQGKQAFLRVKCYNGVPEEFKGKEMKKIPGPRHDRYIQLKELCSKL